MFVTKRKVRLSETDLTGVIYFTNIFKYATEAFEEFLETKNLPLHNLITSSDYSFPIVSAKTSYQAPLFLSDEIRLRLTLAKLGRTSFELHTTIHKEECLAATVEIVHVSVEKKRFTKIPLPQQVCNIFSSNEI